MKKFITGAGALLLVLVLAPTLKADPIGPDCGTCQGSIYTLELLGNPSTNVYDVRLEIDTSGYNGGGGGLHFFAVYNWGARNRYGFSPPRGDGCTALEPYVR